MRLFLLLPLIAAVAACRPMGTNLSVPTFADCPPFSADTAAWTRVAPDSAFSWRLPPDFEFVAVRHSAAGVSTELRAGETRLSWALGRFREETSSGGTVDFVRCEETISGATAHISTFLITDRHGLVVRLVSGSDEHPDLIVEGYGTTPAEQARLLAIARTVRFTGSR